MEGFTYDKTCLIITGMALASPLGSNVETAFNRLKKFENCVKYWEVLDKYDKLNTRLAAFVEGFKTPEHFTRKVTRTMGPVSVMAVANSRRSPSAVGLLEDKINSKR